IQSIPSVDDFLIGRGHVSGRGFHGTLDEIHWYNRGLSEAEISAAHDWMFAPVNISGNATTNQGAAADLVAIREWDSKLLVMNIEPDENGDWDANLAAGMYDITYFAEGCQPVCHG